MEALPLPPKPKPEGDSSSSALALAQLLHVLFFPSFPFLSLPVEVIQKVPLSPGTDFFFFLLGHWCTQPRFYALLQALHESLGIYCRAGQQI